MPKRDKAYEGSYPIHGDLARYIPPGAPDPSGLDDPMTDFARIELATPQGRPVRYAVLASAAAARLAEVEPGAEVRGVTSRLTRRWRGEAWQVTVLQEIEVIETAPRAEAA